MNIEYIFIRKSESTSAVKDSRKFFQNMFKTIFQEVTFDTFEFEVSGSPQKITYKSSISNDDIIYLTISFDSSPYFSAKVLSRVNDCLIGGKHRKDFYIINSYDEPSEYFCEKLAPRFGKFERLMRSFIYISLTKSLGFEWFESTFTEEIQTDIKSKGNIGKPDLIERGLYEMTFAQLYDYLFKAFSCCSAETVVYEQLLTKDLEAMDKEEIVSTISACKKESLWNRFFSETQFDLEEPLRQMREYRNKVAHNKFIKYAEYTDCKRKLIKINQTLEEAIKQINSDIYTEKHFADSLMSFAALFAGLLKNNYDIVATAQKNFNALGKTLIKAIEPYASISNMSTFYKFGAFLSDIQKLRQALDAKGQSIEALPDFYDTSSSNSEETTEASQEDTDLVFDDDPADSNDSCK